MQRMYFTPVTQRGLIAAMAVLISLVMVTSAPVKALTIHEALVAAAQELKQRIDAKIDSSIATIQQNEKDMAELHQKLETAKAQGAAQSLVYTRDDINEYIKYTNGIKNGANQIVLAGTLAVKLQEGRQSNTALALSSATRSLENLVKTGKTVGADAKLLVQQGTQKLADVNKDKAKYTNEQVASITQIINGQIATANSILQSINAQVAAGTSLTNQDAQAANTAAADRLQAVVKSLGDFVTANKTIAENAGQLATVGVKMLQSKIQSDLEAMKHAVTVRADSSGIDVKVNLGKDIVAYTGISIPPEVAQKLKDRTQKTIDTLNAIKDKLKAATDPAVIKAKVQEAVKKINDAALTSVYASTTKAVNSQIKVADSLQVTANALQTQLNKLRQCLQQSSTDPQCATLRTEQNSADQGASLQEKINAMRTNIQTVRTFLGASVNLVSMMKDSNYTGTIKSFTAMTTMMSSLSGLFGGLQNDLNNLSEAINK